MESVRVKRERETGGGERRKRQKNTYLRNPESWAREATVEYVKGTQLYIPSGSHLLGKLGKLKPRGRPAAAFSPDWMFCQFAVLEFSRIATQNRIFVVVVPLRMTLGAKCNNNKTNN